MPDMIWTGCTEIASAECSLAVLLQVTMTVSLTLCGIGRDERVCHMAS